MLRVMGRDVVVVAPPGLAPNAPAPLIIVLHGGLGHAEQIRRTLALDKAAGRLGFRVAYPQGTLVEVSWAPRGRVWNAGTCCGTAQRQNVDDVGFLRALVAELRATGGVRSVGVVGHSNGAMMALAFACRSPGTIDAVVAISGPLLLETCASQPGLRVVHLHGRADKNVLLQGGIGPRSLARVRFPSLRTSQSILGRAGADVRLVIVEAGHRLRGLDRALRVEAKQSLQEFVVKALLP